MTMHGSHRALAGLAMSLGLLAAAPPAAGPPRPPAMVAWSDPTERAFTDRVPHGWTIEGGTHRNAPIDARNYVSARSGDGATLVFVDAPNILPRQEPHPAYYGLGWYDGKVVRTPAGPLLIARYESGSQFAEQFATRGCAAATHGATAMRVSAFDMPGETASINAAIAPIAARAGVHVSASAGDFTFRCGDRDGFTFAVTVLAWTTPQGPRTWAVYKLAGYLTDRAHLDVARYVMNTMYTTLTIDPAWQATYDRQIHDTTGALMEISNRITQQSIERAQQALQQNVEQVRRRQQEFDQISAMRQSSFQKQQASADRIRQRWSDITLGQVHGCDDLGRCATVSNESQYHWTDRSGNVVPGPSDGSPPGPDYHPWKPDS
ncbi:MAG TPA: hypothetical protein VHT53_03500 [Candidatus Elarobacter sp.]|nr:hypothetical protein [Candidatus Elarobacter sp.]